LRRRISSASKSAVSTTKHIHVPLSVGLLALTIGVGSGGGAAAAAALASFDRSLAPTTHLGDGALGGFILAGISGAYAVGIAYNLLPGLSNSLGVTKVALGTRAAIGFIAYVLPFFTMELLTSILSKRILGHGRSYNGYTLTPGRPCSPEL
jgi:hypothetical protein